MDLGLKGKVAVVTGSSRGIGVEIALAFAREGADVAVHYNSSREGAEEAVRQAEALGVESAAFQADISQSSEVTRFIGEIKEHFGAIDILVNNAATVINGPILTFPDEKYRISMGVQLDGCFYCTREALKIMAANGSGKIINISSTAGTGAFAETGAYAAAKAGVIGLTRAVAKEVAPWGIQVNAVAPGFIETPLVAKISRTEVGKKTFDTRQIPARRLGKMSEVAATVAFLASHHADYFVGEVFIMSGGSMTTNIVDEEEE